MLVTFHSKASTSITMFGDAAIELLKMMGHSGTVPSALLAKDVPSALARVRAAVKAVDGTVPGSGAKPGGESGDAAPKVTIPQYAYPLIELLTAAAESGCDVMWEEGSR